jgi:hypothetical protein
MRIVIFGLPKTGTSLLFYRAAATFPDYELNMERPEDLTSGLFLVHKVLVGNGATPDLLNSFSYRLMTVRDPRDRIISWLLYAPYNTLYDNHPRAQAMVKALRQKEADPWSVSVQELCEQHMGHVFRPDLENSAVRLDAAVLSHQVRYEELIKGVADAAISDHLGRWLAPLPADAETKNAVIRRVVRSKSAGYWRDWFTPADVAYFRPQFACYMETFDYADDWELAAEPHLDPHLGSEYLVQLLQRRRQNSPKLRQTPYPL